jgi:ankyrin repeat protein
MSAAEVGKVPSSSGRKERKKISRSRSRSSSMEGRPRVPGIRLTSEIETEDPKLIGLLDAVSQGDYETCEEVMVHIDERYHPRRPADRFVDPQTGDTPLVFAIQNGHREVVDLLIDYGANVNHKWSPLVEEFSLSNIQPLHLAIIALNKSQGETEREDVDKKQHRQDIVLKLINAGADVNALSAKGTPLMLALNGNCVPREDWDFLYELAQILLDHGADPNRMGKQPTNCSHPLNGACFMAYFGTEENRLEIVYKMLECGADPGMYAPGGGGQVSTPLHNAVTRRQWQVVELLLQSEKGLAAVNNKLIDVTIENGCTPLFLSLNDPKIEGRHNEVRKVVSLLLQYGGDIYMPNADGTPPYRGLEMMDTPKMQQLKKLVDRAPQPAPDGSNWEDVFDYWGTERVQEWIGSVGDYRDVQCPVCLAWRDDMQQGGKDFSLCSRCGQQCYCSRDCQKLHWPIHKPVCDPNLKQKE